MSLRLFGLEYPVRLPTVAEIYLYASSVWGTLFDYLMEHRSISKPLPSGVPSSITYRSRDLSLRLFRLEYPIRLPTGTEIYFYVSSSGVHSSITYRSRGLSLCLFRLEYPIRLPTGAEI